MEVDPDLLEESAQQLFDDAPVGYLVTRTDGSIVRVNETFLKWTGYSREALVSGKTFQQLLPVPGRIYYDTHVAPLLQMQGFVREVAFDLNRPDQPTLAVLANLVHKSAAGSPAGFVRITVFDATDRRRYERELLRSRSVAEQATQVERAAREEAERANRAKDDFLALVSHELKTPLSAILGWSQVLRNQSAGNPDIEHGLSVIDRNTRLQARLVDDLLDMSRIVSGKLRLDVQRVDLANVVEAAIDTVRPAADARHIRLQPVLDPGIVVSGDPGRLQQVFWNLLSNAVKFTPTDGSVRIVMERVNSHVEVAVIDSGQGMKPEFLAHAFDRFRQSDSVSTRASRGLGLGLSLVKYLIEMHGGSIQAHSEGDDLGSTFTVKLPAPALRLQGDEERVHPQSGKSTAYAALSAVSLSGIRVLVVDDDRDARQFLWHALTERGAEVIAAEAATDALAALERFQAQVLVSDIGLPGEDGYELIRRVRMLGGDTGRIPAVALSALSRLEDRTRALLAGYQFHLSKPIDAQELVVAVASLAGRLRDGVA